MVKYGTVFKNTFSVPRTMDMNQPMSEEEAREWQERCDAVIALSFL